MQRNEALAKEILETIVSLDVNGAGVDREGIQDLFAKHYPDHWAGRSDSVDYHLHLLETGGFVKRTEEPDEDEIFEMTWAGHDLLESS